MCQDRRFIREATLPGCQPDTARELRPAEVGRAGHDDRPAQEGIEGARLHYDDRAGRRSARNPAPDPGSPSRPRRASCLVSLGEAALIVGQTGLREGHVFRSQRPLRHGCPPHAHRPRGDVHRHGGPSSPSPMRGTTKPSRLPRVLIDGSSWFSWASRTADRNKSS